MWRRASLLSRMFFLASSNLSHSTGRLMLSIATVAAAGLLMFTQLGFLDASLDSQARVVAGTKPDLVLVSRARVSLISDVRFPLRSLVRVRAIHGVTDVVPLYLDSRRFRIRNPQSGKRLLVRVIAVDPVAGVFPELESESGPQTDTLLVDRRSKSLVGVFQPGADIELGERRFRVGGFFSLGSDFVNDGSVLMTTRNLQRLLPADQAMSRLNQVDIGLVFVAPGARLDDILSQARRRLPGDVEILTLVDFLDRERAFWRKHTIVGFVFTFGTLVGVVVGTVICAQLLYSIVWDFRRQFATLKAIGFNRSFIIGTIAVKSCLLAVAGFLPAWLASSALYSELSALTGLTFEMRLGRSVLVLGLILLMTLIAAVAAVRPLLRQDPAELFRD